MTYFNLQNAKIKAVAASVPDDVEYTTDYNLSLIHISEPTRRS